MWQTLVGIRLQLGEDLFTLNDCIYLSYELAVLWSKVLHVQHTTVYEPYTFYEGSLAIPKGDECSSHLFISAVIEEFLKDTCLSVKDIESKALYEATFTLYPASSFFGRSV